MKPPLIPLNGATFTAIYQGKKYTLAGSMDNFKNPKILATIDGPDLQLKADIVKNNDLITINAITGKYLNADFDSKGTINLSAGQEPEFDINTNVSLLLEDLIKDLPDEQKKEYSTFNPTAA